MEAVEDRLGQTRCIQEAVLAFHDTECQPSIASPLGTRVCRFIQSGGRQILSMALSSYAFVDQGGNPGGGRVPKEPCPLSQNGSAFSCWCSARWTPRCVLCDAGCDIDRGDCQAHFSSHGFSSGHIGLVLLLFAPTQRPGPSHSPSQARERRCWQSQLPVRRRSHSSPCQEQVRKVK